MLSEKAHLSGHRYRPGPALPGVGGSNTLVLCQQQSHQFTEVGQEQRSHAGMETTGLLAADSQQATPAFRAKRYQGNRLNCLGLVSKQLLQLFRFKTTALGT